MVELTGTMDRIFILERGRLSPAAKSAFVNGQCHGLALALQQETHWPLVAIDSRNGECLHICVRRPGDQKLVDANGAHTEEQVLEQRPDAVIREIEADEVKALEQNAGWVPPAAEAQTWVDAVLAQAESAKSDPPLTAPTLRVTLPARDDGWQVRFSWGGGETEMLIEVRRQGGSVDWVPYGRLGIPKNPERGVYELWFTEAMLGNVARLWFERSFDEAKADQALAR